MIDRDHDLPVQRQAELMGISRGSVYYLPRPVSDADLRLMRHIDELHLELPFAGSRMLREMLRADNLTAANKVREAVEALAFDLDVLVEFESDE